MIIGAIIVGVLILALMIVGEYIRERFGGSFEDGAFVGVIIMLLMVIEVYLLSNIIGKPKPSAIDVYRGNTELEITSVNGVPTDSVVVFKEK